MSIKLIKKIIGTRNDRILRNYSRIVKQINNLEPTFQKLTDEELKAKTKEFETLQAKNSHLPIE